MNKKKKFFCFLLDKSHSNKSSKIAKFFNKKYNSPIFYNFKKINNFKIVFVLNYTKILPNFFLKKNELVLIPHSSNLPEDKGFSPIQNQILKKKNKITISLVQAIKGCKVDSGPIHLKTNFSLKGHELWEEITKLSVINDIKIIEKYIKLYPKIKSTPQKKNGNFNKKRNIYSNMLNINKNIKSQFNILRISDYNNFPTLFNYKGYLYRIRIEKFKLNEKEKTKKK